MSSVALPAPRYRPPPATRTARPALVSPPGASVTGASVTGASVAGVSAATFRRRRLTVLTVIVVVVFLAGMVIGRVGAEAGLEDRVAGHVVIEPGGTLWDVAVATAPDGVDPRRQLADLRELNGFEGSHVEPWTVVLIPAR